MVSRLSCVGLLALALAAVARAAAPDTPEKVIEDRLRPLERLPLESRGDRPLNVTGPDRVEHPEVPLEVIRNTVIPAEVPLETPTVRPHSLPEGMPLAGEVVDHSLPERVALPEAASLRLPAPAVEEVPPIPLLAGRPPERAPAGDPTRSASRAAVTTAPLPTRDGPLPFERLSLPDPFPLRDEIELGRPPEEALPPPLPLTTPPIFLPAVENQGAG